MSHRLLVINPGSTSTKLAIFEDLAQAHATTVRHDARVLADYPRVAEQYPFRQHMIRDWLKSIGVEPASLAAAVGRGGVLKPILGGTYRVNHRMLEDLARAQYGEHASNLGARLAWEIAAPEGKPAFIVDPVVVDEMGPLARLSGLPEIPRRSLFHALNQKAVARRAAHDLGRSYEQVNLIVTHMGGGITVGAHLQGHVVDVNNGLDGEGPMSPERAGTAPSIGLVHLCYSWRYSLAEITSRLVGRGGLVAYLGTNDALEVEQRIAAGDEQAKLLYEAMAYQVAKEIGRAAAVLRGRLDAIVITGGLARSEGLIASIERRVAFLGRVLVYPGEDELKALAEGALRVLEGEEEAREYR
ncbi:MAG: butyrate kinase [Symbiobacteriia bacterium]